jgi:adenine deaminase
MKLCCRLLLLVWLLAAPTAIFRTAHLQSESVSPTCDLVVTNARIVDGSGNPWFRTDIGVRDGRIVRSVKIVKPNARQIIGAKGQILLPGFIDVHKVQR